MTSPRISLSISSLILICSILFAFSGGLSAYLWVLSNTKWDEHLEKASIAGERIIYEIFLEKKIVTSNLLKEIKHSSLIEDLSVETLSNLLAIDSRFIKKFSIDKSDTLQKKENINVYISSESNFLLGYDVQERFNKKPILAIKALFKSCSFL